MMFRGWFRIIHLVSLSFFLSYYNNSFIFLPIIRTRKCKMVVVFISTTTTTYLLHVFPDDDDDDDDD